MIQLTPQMRILVALEPVDFRKRIDGLAALCRSALTSDPFSGTVFVFCSRRRKALRVLAYDGQGFWLCQKRLSEGRFRWWPQPAASSATADQATAALAAHQLTVLFSAGNPNRTAAAPEWRSVTPKA